MPGHDRLKLARDADRAYESGDRRIIEELLTDDFTFYSLDAIRGSTARRT